MGDLGLGDGIGGWEMGDARCEMGMYFGNLEHGSMHESFLVRYFP